MKYYELGANVPTGIDASTKVTVIVHGYLNHVDFKKPGRHSFGFS